MVTWDINSEGVMGTLKQMQGDAGGFQGIGEKLGTALQDAAKNASMSGEGGMVAMAISEFADKWKNSLPGMVEHTGAVLQGTSNVVQAFEKKQFEMAQLAQQGIQAAEGVKPRGLLRSSTAVPPSQQV